MTTPPLDPTAIVGTTSHLLDLIHQGHSKESGETERDIGAEHITVDIDTTDAYGNPVHIHGTQDRFHFRSHRVFGGNPGHDTTQIVGPKPHRTR